MVCWCGLIYCVLLRTCPSWGICRRPEVSQVMVCHSTSAFCNNWNEACPKCKTTNQGADACSSCERAHALWQITAWLKLKWGASRPVLTEWIVAAQGPEFSLHCKMQLDSSLGHVELLGNIHTAPQSAWLQKQCAQKQKEHSQDL